MLIAQHFRLKVALRRRRNTASASEIRVQRNNLKFRGAINVPSFLSCTSFLLLYEEERRSGGRDLGAPPQHAILLHTWEARGGGVGRTRQPSEPCRWTGAAASEGKEGGRLPDDAFRDPYAPLTRANAADDCDWLKRRPSRVSAAGTEDISMSEWRQLRGRSRVGSNFLCRFASVFHPQTVPAVMSPLPR